MKKKTSTKQSATRRNALLKYIKRDIFSLLLLYYFHKLVDSRLHL